MYSFFYELLGAVSVTQKVLSVAATDSHKKDCFAVDPPLVIYSLTCMSWLDQITW